MYCVQGTCLIKDLKPQIRGFGTNSQHLSVISLELFWKVWDQFTPYCLQSLDLEEKEQETLAEGIFLRG